MFLLLLRWGRRMIEGESEKTGAEQFLFLWRPPSALPPPLSRSHYTHIHQQIRVCFFYFRVSPRPQALLLLDTNSSTSTFVGPPQRGFDLRKEELENVLPPFLPPLLAYKTPMTTMVGVTL